MRNAPLRHLIIAGLAVMLVLRGQQSSQTALAVSYAAGWNLVSGPEGSTLSGATGFLYTLQPGDTDYERLPATSPLHAGYGYWAYFPDGGSISFAASAPGLTITPVPGQYLMLGNPSQSVATVDGADQLLTYTPAAGYQPSTVIPPGQGAWVTGYGQLALHAAVDAAPVTTIPAAGAAVPPPSTHTDARPPATITGLQAIALSAADLPGYTQNVERPFFSDPAQAVASYFSIWSAARTVTVVSETIITAFSAGGADDAIAAGLNSHTTDPDQYNQRSFAVSGLGETSAGLVFNYSRGTASVAEYRALYFRRGVVAVEIDTLGDPDTTSAEYNLALARIIDSRLTGGTAAAAALTTNGALQPTPVIVVPTPAP